MFFTDRQDFSLPVGSYIFCSEAFAFESIFPLIQIKHGLYLSNNEPQEVSRSHSTEKKSSGRAEQS